MDPQSRIPSLILALRGGFLYCPDRKSFPGLGRWHRLQCKDRKMYASVGIDLLCIWEKERLWHGLPVFSSWASHLWVAWLWAKLLLMHLCLSFLICEMRIIIPPNSWDCWEEQRCQAHRAWSLVPGLWPKNLIIKFLAEGDDEGDGDGAEWVGGGLGCLSDRMQKGLNPCLRFLGVNKGIGSSEWLIPGMLTDLFPQTMFASFIFVLFRFGLGRTPLSGSQPYHPCQEECLEPGRHSVNIC